MKAGKEWKKLLLVLLAFWIGEADCLRHAGYDEEKWPRKQKEWKKVYFGDGTEEGAEFYASVVDLSTECVNTRIFKVKEVTP